MPSRRRVIFHVLMPVVSMVALSYSHTLFAINKCVASSGAVTYSDEPCESGSTAQSVELKARPRTAGTTSSPDQVCEEMNRRRTPQEMIARAEAVRRGEIPEGETCCRNGKVVPCESQR